MTEKIEPHDPRVLRSAAQGLRLHRDSRRASMAPVTGDTVDELLTDVARLLDDLADGDAP